MDLGDSLFPHKHLTIPTNGSFVIARTELIIDRQVGSLYVSFNVLQSREFGFSVISSNFGFVTLINDAL